MYLLSKLKKYFDIEYDPCYKWIVIRQKVSVADFIEIKKILKSTTLDIRNIEVRG